MDFGFFKVILILFFLTIGRNAYSQTELNNRDNERVISSLMKLGEDKETVEEYWHVVTRIQKKIEDDLRKNGASDTGINRRALDSALLVMKRYFSFNKMFLDKEMKHPKSGNAFIASRRDFADSMCVRYNIQQFFPLLDSLYNSRLLKIGELLEQKQ